MSNTERRNFLKMGGAGLVGMAGILASGQAPAAATSGKIRFDVVSAFPKTLDTIYWGAEDAMNLLREMSDGKYDGTVHAAGEIVPGLKALDAASDGTAQVAHTALYYHFDKDDALAEFASIPFGPDARGMIAWMHHGGGNELANEVCAKFNLVHFACGNTGAQMGGWFKDEIRSKDDLKGLKMRLGGFAGKVLQPMGIQPVTLPGGEIMPAAEKGLISALEWVGPYDDEKLGFYKLFKNYAYPAFWEGGTQLSMTPNKKWWDPQPADFKAMFKAACMAATQNMLAKYDAKNPAALSSLMVKGVKVFRLPKDVMDQAYYISEQLYADISSKNPLFAKVHNSMTKFRDKHYQWHRLAEQTYNSYMTNQRGNRI